MTPKQVHQPNQTKPLSPIYKYNNQKKQKVKSVTN